MDNLLNGDSWATLLLLINTNKLSSPFEKGGKGDLSKMLKYDTSLKPKARSLRSNMTDAEQWLWSKLRRKQVLDIQFYRQKPIGHFIVDFYAPKVSLVIELDGGQHFEPDQQDYDRRRTAFLEYQGLTVLRFTNLEVLRNIDGVMEVILSFIEKH